MPTDEPSSVVDADQSTNQPVTTHPERGGQIWDSLLTMRWSRTITC